MNVILHCTAMHFFWEDGCSHVFFIHSIKKKWKKCCVQALINSLESCFGHKQKHYIYKRCTLIYSHNLQIYRKITTFGGYSKCTIKSNNHSSGITCDKSVVSLLESCMKMFVNQSTKSSAHVNAWKSAHSMNACWLTVIWNGTVVSPWDGDLYSKAWRCESSQ